MLTIILFIIGLGLLIGGAEVLVRGATRLAIGLGVPPLIVGLTVVAYATSSPELAVSVKAVREGQPDIALGNVIGSNIYNVLFILGISASIVPLAVSRRLVRLEVPLMIAASGLLYMMAISGTISRLKGGILVAGAIAYTLFVVWEALRPVGKRPTPEEAQDEKDFAEERGSKSGHWLVNVVLIGIGLGMLVLGSEWLVNGAVEFARYLGVTEAIIALTIVAAGTGLPETATSVIAGLRGERDLAVGNVVGSNIFNILAVLGIGALAAPEGLPVPAVMLSFDIPVMLATAVVCLPILYTGYQISRWQGLLLLGYYMAYTTFLVLSATGSAALRVYSMAMLVFLLPMTGLTLVVMAVREIMGKRKG